ncbi:hypothetical protein E8E12_003293 [Didymella heteroderae]|uniref:Uncharacterized protein n=1 Tax=Didymella heteroderae TaxID=1769908 RepID=A0A9P4WWL9_9PLEO|nr:hypothetical protein E8E12_003293 [Didymella heteroderae]
MANNTPTSSRIQLTKIPTRTLSTRKHTSYNRSVRRYDFKYRGLSTRDTSLTTSKSSPTSTSGHASPDIPPSVAHKADQPKETRQNILTPVRTSPARSPLLHAQHNKPIISKAVLTSKLGADTDEIYTSPDVLLRQTQALLHAELETLMQALYLRISAVHASPAVAAKYVDAFERLAADTFLHERQNIAKDETRWVAKIDADLCGQDESVLRNKILREVLSAQAAHESKTVSALLGQYGQVL